MADYTKEITKRRTFAIISHPDAGKTTLTEKFLLYGGRQDRTVLSNLYNLLKFFLLFLKIQCKQGSLAVRLLNFCTFASLSITARQQQGPIHLQYLMKM